MNARFLTPRSGRPLGRPNRHAGLKAGCSIVVMIGLGVSAATQQTSSPMAVVTGIVVTDDATARPLGRAVVTVAGGSLVATRSTISGDDGRFTLRNVPAGRVTITASKRGYVAGAYGARRPGRPGTPALLVGGQMFDAMIRLSPAGVLTGMVRDDRGDPIAGVRVFAIDAARPAAPDPASGVAGAETDERGVYRLFDLAPRTYVLAAAQPGLNSANVAVTRRTVSETDAVFASLRGRGARLATTGPPPAAPMPASATIAVAYYPNTPFLGDATKVPLDRGEVKSGLDIRLAPVSVTSIDGSVLSTEGALPQNVQLSISAGARLSFVGLASANPQLTLRPGPDGRFTYANVIAGRYAIAARGTNTPESGRGGAISVAGGRGISSGPSPGSPDTLYAVETLDVGGSPVAGVTLRLQRGARFAGKIEFDASTQPAPAQLSGIRIALQPQRIPPGELSSANLADSLGTLTSADTGPNGTFEFLGVAPGRYTITATVPPASGQGWRLGSAMVGGRDALDSTLHVTLGTDLTGATVTMTDRHSELSGTLRTSAGQPAPDFFIIVFPVDPTLRPSPRRVVSTRPATDGQFSVRNLPAGEYLVTALTDVEPNEWQRLEFLAEIAPAGVRLTLGASERKVQDLVIK